MPRPRLGAGQGIGAAEAPAQPAASGCSQVRPGFTGTPPITG